jgi:hypothetical protein
MIKFLQKIDRFLQKTLDVVLAMFLWVGGGIALVAATFAGACAVIVSIVMSLAVPAFCIIAAWGILKYFGVL